MSAPTMEAIGARKFVLGDVDEGLVEVEDAETGWLPVVVETVAVEVVVFGIAV